jgi:hypothetical protein
MHLYNTSTYLVRVHSFVTEYTFFIHGTTVGPSVICGAAELRAGSSFTPRRRLASPTVRR